MKLTFPGTLYLKIEETEKWHQREQIFPFFFKVKQKQSPIPKIGFWGVLRICCEPHLCVRGFEMPALRANSNSAVYSSATGPLTQALLHSASSSLLIGKTEVYLAPAAGRAHPLYPGTGLPPPACHLSPPSDSPLRDLGAGSVCYYVSHHLVCENPQRNFTRVSVVGITHSSE